MLLELHEVMALIPDPLRRNRYDFLRKPRICDGLVVVIPWVAMWEAFAARERKL